MFTQEDLISNTFADSPAAVVPAEPAASPVERLNRNAELHATVLKMLKDRLEYSERAMSNHYARWRYNEQAVQAYVKLPDFEKRLKNANENGAPPEITTLVVPYTYATIDAMATYLTSALFGQDPIFPLVAGPGSLADNALVMEQVLQYNADHTRLVKEGFQFLWDSLVYGFGALQCQYTNKRGLRTVVSTVMGQTQRVREERLIYSGNMVESIDPYKFFPDPREPIASVSRKGDFCFWRSFKSRLDLVQMEEDGVFVGVDKISNRLPRFDLNGDSHTDSNRNIRVGSFDMASERDRGGMSIDDFIQVDQGVVRLVPSKYGLSDSDQVEMWLFTMGNKERVIQAEKLEFDHDMKPVVATEPQGFGYDFGSLAATDFLLPFQEAISWFLNSRIYNVRLTSNNMFIVDPSRIEMQDLQRPGPGKLIRLKRAFYGSDVRQAISQLGAVDVTQSHVMDMQNLQRIADSILGVNDNLRGIPTVGGRRSATESRISSESGVSRLGHMARSISADAMVDLGQQMSINIQQFMPDEMAFNVIGKDGHIRATTLRPEMVAGDFNFRVSDGTVPTDRYAVLDTLREVFSAIVADPELRQSYSVPSLLQYMAKLAGVHNIENFRVQMQVQSPEAIAQGVQSGNLLPAGAPF